MINFYDIVVREIPEILNDKGLSIRVLRFDIEEETAGVLPMKKDFCSLLLSAPTFSSEVVDGTEMVLITKEDTTVVWNCGEYWVSVLLSNPKITDITSDFFSLRNG